VKSALAALFLIVAVADFLVDVAKSAAIVLLLYLLWSQAFGTPTLTVMHFDGANVDAACLRSGLAMECLVVGRDGGEGL